MPDGLILDLQYEIVHCVLYQLSFSSNSTVSLHLALQCKSVRNIVTLEYRFVLTMLPVCSIPKERLKLLTKFLAIPEVSSTVTKTRSTVYSLHFVPTIFGTTNKAFNKYVTE